MSINESIKKVRTNYTKALLNKAGLPDNPITLFESWIGEALKTELDPNAMTISSIGLDGFPQNRVVLLRSVSDAGFVFFTNYTSAKGKEILNNNKVALTFFWASMQQQVRITGVAQKTSEKESDDYFASRPRESQIGAWASEQSSAIENRELLEQQVVKFEKQFEGQVVPRPDFWGGFCIQPKTIEFWQGRASRLHDRIVYTATEENQWLKTRLCP